MEFVTWAYNDLRAKLGELDAYQEQEHITGERLNEIRRVMAHIVFELLMREQEIGLHNTEDLEDEQ